MPEPHDTPLIGTKGYEEKLQCLYKESNGNLELFIKAAAEKFAIQEWEHRRLRQASVELERLANGMRW